MEGKQQHEIEELVKKLRNVVKLKDNSTKTNCNEDEVIKILDFLVDASKSYGDGSTEFTLDDVFLMLLTHESNVIVAKTAKTIAEIAQTEIGREKCTRSNLAKSLMDLLKGDDINILTQTSRALGNICYENESGNKMVQENDGLKYILKVLNRGVNLNDAEGAEFLRNVAAGFLLNYLVDQPILQQQALEAGLIPIICSVLEIDGSKAGKAAMHSLLTLEIINESGIELLDERLTKVLVDILANDTSSELAEMCLGILHGQAENESAKLLLAKSGVCELLLQLLEKHVSKCINEETRSVLKVACNLIVLIITGDDSMNFLYANSEGIVYKKLVEWLQTNIDIDLQIAAVLAMGNFARTDSHCQLMVEQGVHKYLFELLKLNSNSDGDIRFQHALLSAVRNLVIPANNKPIMLSDGLIDIVYPMLDIPTFPVVFKLLGTLRIVIDNQRDAAILLGNKDDLIKRTIEWCNTEDHPGVQGEANRLISWLVINSKDVNVVLLLIKHGATKYLVKMITGPHALMQNEALLSLVTMTTIALKECEVEFVNANIGDALKKFFDESAGGLQLPIIENAITFLIMMASSSDVLKEHLKCTSLLETLQSSSEDSTNWKNLLSEKTKALISLLKN